MWFLKFLFLTFFTIFVVGEVLWKLSYGRKETKEQTVPFFVIVAHLGDLIANTFPSMPLIGCTNCKAAVK